MSFKELITDSLTVTGLNYKTNPNFSHLSLTKDKVQEIYQTHSDNTDYLILNTCNRIELWSYEQPESSFKDLLNLTPDYHLKGDHAWDWMCRVTSGLESEVRGEEEIGGQVRTMLKERKTYLKKMEGILNSVIWMSRKIRNGHKPKTIGEGVYEFLKRTQKNIQSKKIIIIGMGMVGKDCLKHVSHLNPETIVGINRTPLPNQPHSLADLHQWLHLYHVIIICTDSPEPLLNGDQWKDHLIIDLSIPRNTTGDGVVLLREINRLRGSQAR